MTSERIHQSAAEQKAGSCQWCEAPVDKSFDHFELRYGDASSSGGWDAWILVAIVGIIHEGLVNVEFLVDKTDARHSKIVEDTVKELNFYLVELGEEDPWQYLQYHCGTASNIYSSVHWDFIKGSANPTESQKALSK